MSALGTKRTCRRSPRASAIEGRRDLAQMRAAQLPDAGEAPLSPLPRIEEGKRRHPAGVLVEDHGAGDRRPGAPLPILRLSQRLWLRPCLNRRQRFATDLGLKPPQPLIDRNQFDDRAP
jgi:hypothetical protein